MQFIQEKNEKLKRSVMSMSGTFKSGKTDDNDKEIIKNFRDIYLEEFNKGNADNVKKLIKSIVKKEMENINKDGDNNNLLKPEAPIASKEVKQEDNDDNNNCLKPGAQIESKENDNINDKRKMIISSKFGSMNINPYEPLFIGRHELNDLHVFDNFTVSELNDLTEREKLEDITISSNINSISRIQCILMFIPNNKKSNDKRNYKQKIIGKIRIIDFWSFGGTSIISDFNEDKSIDDKRKLLEIDIYPDIIYNLNFNVNEVSNYKHNLKIAYTENNTKNCMICVTMFRDIIFKDCKHQIMCKKCFVKNKIKNCPLCRKEIKSVIENNMKTIKFNKFERKFNCFDSYAANIGLKKA